MKANFCRKEAGNPVIGVLALQGNFQSHIRHISALGLSSAEIRKPEELDFADGLIIPGGESTTMLNFFKKAPWAKAISQFSLDRPVFGTCAGAILLAKYVENPEQESLGLVPVRIIRNGYGRQKESFYAELKSDIFGDIPIKCYFIRAPVIAEILDPEVDILACWKGSPVFIKYRNILCSTFHSELSDDLKLHRLFADMLKCTSLA